MELYFSRPDWHILVEEINSLSQLPLGMRTYIADSVCISLKSLMFIIIPSLYKATKRSINYIQLLYTKYLSNTYSNGTKLFYRKIQQNLITKSLVTITNLIRAIPCGKILMLPPV